MKRILLTLVTVIYLVGADAQTDRPVLDIMLSNYDYPFTVHYLDLNNQNQQLKMAYMDVRPARPNGKTVVLLHRKNFNGAYCKTAADVLTESGYRVVIPDQVGFGKSSKPVGYPFSFQQLAQNTKALLDELRLDNVYLLGHSMGGMLATRFSLMYPETVGELVLENPTGPEDWKLVAPYVPIDAHYRNELKANYETTRKYQQGLYYEQHCNGTKDGGQPLYKNFHIERATMALFQYFRELLLRISFGKFIDQQSAKNP